MKNGKLNTNNNLPLIKPKKLENFSYWNLVLVAKQKKINETSEKVW